VARPGFTLWTLVVGRWQCVCCDGCQGAPGRCTCPRVIDVDVIQYQGTGRALNRIEVIPRDPRYIIHMYKCRRWHLGYTMHGSVAPQLCDGQMSLEKFGPSCSKVQFLTQNRHIIIKFSSQISNYTQQKNMFGDKTSDWEMGRRECPPQSRPGATRHASSSFHWLSTWYQTRNQSLFHALKSSHTSFILPHLISSELSVPELVAAMMKWVASPCTTHFTVAGCDQSYS